MKFNNWDLEMYRRKIKKADIAGKLGITPKTLQNKLDGNSDLS